MESTDQKQINCQQCKAILTVHQSQRGSRIKCPQCGAFVRVAFFNRLSIAQQQSQHSDSGYYCYINGVMQGPFESYKIYDLLEKRQLLPTDLLWKDGMTDWTPANEIAIFRSMRAMTSCYPELKALERRPVVNWVGISKVLVLILIGIGLAWGLFYGCRYMLQPKVLYVSTKLHDASGQEYYPSSSVYIIKSGYHNDERWGYRLNNARKELRDLYQLEARERQRKGIVSPEWSFEANQLMRSLWNELKNSPHSKAIEAQGDFQVDISFADLPPGEYFIVVLCKDNKDFHCWIELATVESNKRTEVIYDTNNKAY